MQILAKGELSLLVIPIVFAPLSMAAFATSNTLLDAPEFEIIMVFQNPNIKINKNSKTSYADYCDKNNIKWMNYKDL